MGLIKDKNLSKLLGEITPTTKLSQSAGNTTSALFSHFKIAIC